MKYVIQITACYDKTAFAVELTDDQIDAVIKICDLSHKTSIVDYMPVMDVYKYQDVDLSLIPNHIDDENYKLYKGLNENKRLNMHKH